MKKTSRLPKFYLLILCLSLSSIYTIFIITRNSLFVDTKVRLQDVQDMSTKDHPKKACVIPKLNPYDANILKYIEKNVNSYSCNKKSYGILNNGLLKVKANNVRDVYFRIILRPDGDDFSVNLSPLFKVRKEEPKRRKIEPGMTGCLVSQNGELFGINAFNQRKCMIIDENCNGTCSFEFKDRCSKNSPKFQFSQEGFVKEAATGKCLVAINERPSGNEAVLQLTNCSETSKWEFIDFPVMDFDITRSVDGDFLELQVIQDNHIHKEYLISAKEKDKVIKRVNSIKNRTALPYNIAILVFDSQSASNVERSLQKTLKTLKDDQNTVILKGHTVVGDGTTAQLTAILAGALEENLPEARRGKSGAQHVDRWPFIFDDFVNKGYATFFNEDSPGSGCFNYRLHGFKKQPTDHYSRPFWLKAEETAYNISCVGSDFIFNINLDYTLSFYNVYQKIPKFSITIFSNIFHDDLNRVRLSDESISQFINKMTKQDHQSETILLIMADHGPRISEFRATMIGKLEERLPFLSITLPSRLIKSYPEFKAALQHNSNGLTSHFDIHATLHHLLSFPLHRKVATGQSLFTMIDQSKRTCEMAGVKDFWCPCLQFTVQNTNDSDVREAALATVDYINNEIIGQNIDGKTHCRLLELDSIIRAGKRAPSEAVQRFQWTRRDSKCDECNVVYGKSPENKALELEVVFAVKQSGGIFEAKATKRDEQWFVDKEIGRLNLYGDQPKCIARKYLHLRKYCYCK